MHKLIGPKLTVPVSPATLAGKTLYATNLSTNLETGDFIPGSIEVQARQTFSNLLAFVEQAGGRASDVAQITVFLIDAADFPGMNAAYKEVFVEAPFPTRATIIVKALIGPPGILIETTTHALVP